MARTFFLYALRTNRTMTTFNWHFRCSQSCCGKSNLFKRFADPDKTLGKACYEEVSERLKQGKTYPHAVFHKEMKTIHYLHPLQLITEHCSTI